MKLTTSRAGGMVARPTVHRCTGDVKAQDRLLARVPLVSHGLCSMLGLQSHRTLPTPDLPRLVCHCIQSDDYQTAEEPSTSGRPLPTVSRQQVFINCSVVSAVFAAAATGLRLATPIINPFVFRNDPAAVQALLQVGSGNYQNHFLVMLATAGLVTAARLALLSTWPAFAEATDASNQQVLASLTQADLLWVSCLPGISEELLFRGGLIPATFPDWRGAILSAAIFGFLHNTGGRNWAFAAWASAVGLLYSISFLNTQDLLVPAGAHCIANYASASLWLRKRSHAS